MNKLAPGAHRAFLQELRTRTRKKNGCKSASLLRSYTFGTVLIQLTEQEEAKELPTLSVTYGDIEPGSLKTFRSSNPEDGEFCSFKKTRNSHQVIETITR